MNAARMSRAWCGTASHNLTHLGATSSSLRLWSLRSSSLRLSSLRLTRLTAGEYLRPRSGLLGESSRKRKTGSRRLSDSRCNRASLSRRSVVALSARLTRLFPRCASQTSQTGRTQTSGFRHTLLGSGVSSKCTSGRRAPQNTARRTQARRTAHQAILPTRERLVPSASRRHNGAASLLTPSPCRLCTVGGGKTCKTDYYYQKAWRSQHISSDGFFNHEYSNPSSWVFDSMAWTPTTLHAGNYSLPRPLIAQVADCNSAGCSTNVPPQAAVASLPICSRYTAGCPWSVRDGYYFYSSGRADGVGDIRVLFQMSTADAVSVVAVQQVRGGPPPPQASHH